MISYVGGFIQSVIVLLGFFIGEYNEYNYTMELANKIYNFEFKNEEEDF